MHRLIADVADPEAAAQRLGRGGPNDRAFIRELGAGPDGFVAARGHDAQAESRKSERHAMRHRSTPAP
jgi:hypothetical protein